MKGVDSQCTQAKVKDIFSQFYPPDKNQYHQGEKDAFYEFSLFFHQEQDKALMIFRGYIPGNTATMKRHLSVFKLVKISCHFNEVINAPVGQIISSCKTDILLTLQEKNIWVFMPYHLITTIE